MQPRPFLLLGIVGTILFAVGFSTTLLEAPQMSAQQSQLKLPNYLDEASGLSKFSETQLLVHNDEKGHIYAISLSDYQVTKLVSLGDPVVRDDFEGVAVHGKSVFLVTSTGKLYVLEDVSSAASNQVSEWKTFDTGLSRVCEIEGLHYDDGALLLACKNIFKSNSKNTIAVYSYMPGHDAIAKPLFRLSDTRLTKGGRRVTAIESDNSFYYLLTQVSVLRVHRDTLSIDIYPLNPKVHKQPEGIALMNDGSLYVVDERRKNAGGLSHYIGVDAISAN